MAVDFSKYVGNKPSTSGLADFSKYTKQSNNSQTDKTGTDFWGGLKTFAKGLTLLPKQIGASLLQATQGQKGASVVNRDWADKFIEGANQDLNSFVNEVYQEHGEENFLPWIKISDIAQIPQSMAYSLSSFAGGVGATVATGGNLFAGGLAAGGLAYRATTYQIMQEYLDDKNQEKIARTGKGLTQAEEDRLRDDFDEKAAQYGLWEAVPEAVSETIFLGAGSLAYGAINKTLTPALTKFLSKNTAAKIVAGVAGMYGEEMATETITQKGQSDIEVEAGLRNGRLTWTEAFKEIAPQTFLLTTIMGGAGATAIKLSTAKAKIKESLNKEVPKDSQIKRTILEGIEGGINQVEQGTQTTQIAPGVTPQVQTPTKPVTFQNRFPIGSKVEYTKMDISGNDTKTTGVVKGYKTDPTTGETFADVGKNTFAGDTSNIKSLEPTQAQTTAPHGTPSGVAKGFAQKATKEGISNLPDLATFESSTIAEQDRLMKEYFDAGGIEIAGDILDGKQPLPKGVKALNFLDSLEKYMKQDPIKYEALIKKLISSPLNTVASEAGSTLGLAQKRDGNTFVQRVKRINKEKSERKGGIKKKEVITEAKKKNLSQTELEQKLSNYIDKLTC